MIGSPQCGRRIPRVALGLRDSEGPTGHISQWAVGEGGSVGLGGCSRRITGCRSYGVSGGDRPALTLGGTRCAALCPSASEIWAHVPVFRLHVSAGLRLRTMSD